MDTGNVTRNSAPLATIKRLTPRTRDSVTPGEWLSTRLCRVYPETKTQSETETPDGSHTRRGRETPDGSNKDITQVTLGYTSSDKCSEWIFTEFSCPETHKGVRLVPLPSPYDVLRMEVTTGSGTVLPGTVNPRVRRRRRHTQRGSDSSTSLTPGCAGTSLLGRG